MCDINAFILKNGEEVKVMENVDVVTSGSDAFRLQNIFGEETLIEGRMVSFNNSDKKMVFEPA
jgi:predicted RNA-binding protein